MSAHLKISCPSEYDALKRVIVVSPTFMEIREIINEIQVTYAAENIDKTIAKTQHDGFIDTLRNEGIDVIQLEPHEQLNEQVFTRDIGFVIADTLFIANMDKAVRKPETALFKEWLTEEGITYVELDAYPIEGGDVIVDGKTIWIGISDRTGQEAIHELQEKLPDYEVHAIPIRDDILHLDCTFNLVDSSTALVYPDGIEKKALQQLKERYQFIEITDEEQFQLGTNVLSIGNKKIVSLPENSRINQALEKAGFSILEVAFSEIIKSGGSFRCCTLPLVRG